MKTGTILEILDSAVDYLNTEFDTTDAELDRPWRNWLGALIWMIEEIRLDFAEADKSDWPTITSVEDFKEQVLADEEIAEHFGIGGVGFTANQERIKTDMFTQSQGA